MSSPFLRSVEEHMRVRRYSRRTVNAYLYWIKGYIIFNGKQRPEFLNEAHVERYLTWLAEVVQAAFLGLEKVASALQSSREQLYGGLIRLLRHPGFKQSCVRLIA